MNHYNSLQEYFDSEIEPAIPILKQQYEQYFLQRKRKILHYMNWTMIALMAIVTGLRLFFPNVLPPNIIGISFMVLFLYFVVKYLFVDNWVQGGSAAEAFRLKFKQKMVQPILHVFGDYLQLLPDARMDTDTLYKSGLFSPMKNTAIRGEDLVEGKYRGFDIRFSEMAVIKKDSGERSDEPFFQGLFLEATLPVNLNLIAYIIPVSAFGSGTDLLKMKILPSKDMTYQQQKAYNMEIAMQAMSGYRWDVTNVETDVDLHEMEVKEDFIREGFKVFAPSSQDVDKLMTAMDLKNYLFTYGKDDAAMKTATSTKSFHVIDNAAIERLARTNFCMAVVNDKAYLAVPFAGKNLFDPDWSDDFLSFKNVEVMYEELNSVFNFLDSFTF